METVGLPTLMTLGGLWSSAGVLPPLALLVILSAALPPPLRLMSPPSFAERVLTTD